LFIVFISCSMLSNHDYQSATWRGCYKSSCTSKLLQRYAKLSRNAQNGVRTWECRCASDVRRTADLCVKMCKWQKVAHWETISFDLTDIFLSKQKVSSLSSKESLPLRGTRCGEGWGKENADVSTSGGWMQLCSGVQVFWCSGTLFFPIRFLHIICVNLRDLREKLGCNWRATFYEPHPLAPSPWMVEGGPFFFKGIIIFFIAWILTLSCRTNFFLQPYRFLVLMPAFLTAGFLH